jgi:hypothetical protein
MVHHLIDDFGGHPFCRYTKEPVAVGTFLVYEDDHPAFPEFLNTFLNSCERHNPLTRDEMAEKETISAS